MSHRSNRPVDWEALVTEHENRLYRTALVILGDNREAEDAVQDTFIAYWQKAPSHLENSGGLANTGVGKPLPQPSPLSLAAARRPLWEGLEAPGPEERQELEELWGLPPADRAVLHFFYYEDLSTAEIAQITGVRESTVRSRLTRARGRLRKLLEGE